MALRQYLPDSMSAMMIGAALAAAVAGALGGVAAAVQFAPDIARAVAGRPAIPLCQEPLPSDGIGFRILLDEAKRRGDQANA